MVSSYILQGYSALPVTVECSITNGLPSLTIVGLANKSVDEAKERLRAAITASGYSFPKQRILINLAPADVPKNSASLDLAMAIAILHADKQIVIRKSTWVICIGELGLDGSVRPAKGIIGLLQTIATSDATVFIPVGNSTQASYVGKENVFAAANLREVVDHLQTNKHITPVIPKQEPHTSQQQNYHIDFAEIKGQDHAKRALTIAAAGRHNILLSGPPGTGKSMLAKAFIGILPQLNRDEALDTTHLHSLINAESEHIITKPPLRTPHHSTSNVALLGGGHTLRPGDISLAHNGVLFLDELPEFTRGAIEGLRQPLEDNQVTISRAQQSATFPANFILIATSNPCPCGYYNSSKSCSCSANEIHKYQKKLSGPILDRIDIHVTVNTVEHKSLLIAVDQQESPKIQTEVLQARKRQLSRSKKLNANLSNKELITITKVQPAAKDLLDTASAKMDISARAYIRIIKIARTIADLDNSDYIEQAHIAEALQYRPKIFNL